MRKDSVRSLGHAQRRKPEWHTKNASIYALSGHEIVGEFSLICCTSMAHEGNTKIWAKIISAYAKKCSITGFSSLRGGGGAKNARIYALSGHERIEKRSDK